MLTRKRILLAKTEVTYGTDPVPTGAANAVLVSNLDVVPLDSELVERNLVRPYLGASESYVAGASVKVTFDVEIQGSGAAGTAPGYDALLKACAMGSTVVASTSVTYAPISAAFPSATIYYNVDGVLHKVTGARGNVELSLEAGKIPVYKFTFVGLYNPPTDTAAPTPTYTAYKDPLVVNSDNTNGFTLFSHAGILASLNLNFNNGVTFRRLVNAEDVLIIDRKVTGTVVIEAPTIATKDYFTLANGNTLGGLDITHGVAAGLKVQITSSRVNLHNPQYQDMDGVQMLSIPFDLVPSTAGNDEISIVVK